MPTSACGVEQHRDLDAVADREGQRSSSSRRAATSPASGWAKPASCGTVEVQQRARDELGDAAALAGARPRRRRRRGAGSAPLTSASSERAKSGASRPGEHALAEVLGVGVDVGDDVARRWPRARATWRRPCRGTARTPAAGRPPAPPSAPAARAAAAVPSREAASTTSSSSTTPASTKRRSAATVRPMVVATSRAGTTTRDRRGLARGEVGGLQRAGPRRRCDRASRRARGRAPGRGRRARPARGEVRTRAPAIRAIGTPSPPERAREGLVLERRAGLQAADLAVGLGGDRDRGAAEVRVRGSGQRAQPLGQADGPAARDAVVEALDDHLAADRARSLGGRIQQRGEPAGLDLGVGVRGGHEAVRRPGGEQPLAGDAHAQPSRRAHAERGALDDVQAQVAGGLAARARAWRRCSRRGRG